MTDSSMLNDFFADSQIPMPWESFLALPRHPAYRYEYRDGQARIVGNPRYYHARLMLSSLPEILTREPSGGDVSCFFSAFELRLIADTDWALLPELFAAAFHRSPPLSCLSRDERLIAAEKLLGRTQSGEDGPLVPQACLALCERETGDLIGASLITLVPAGDLEDFSQQDWKSTPPSSAVAAGWGQPHLTWIFISTEKQRRSLGIVLLREAVSVLKRLGYPQLVSTFLLGDNASMLWHWRCGFELMSHPGSPRHLVDEKLPRIH